MLPQQTRRHHRHAGPADERYDRAGRRARHHTAGRQSGTADFNEVEERLKACTTTIWRWTRCRNVPVWNVNSAGLDELVADLNNRRCAERRGGRRTAAGMVDHGVRRHRAVLRRSSPTRMVRRCRPPPTASRRWMSNTCVPSDRWSRRNPCAACATCCSPARRKPTCCTRCWPARPVPLDRMRREHPEILAAAKPILVATPATLAALTEPTTACRCRHHRRGRAYSGHPAAQHRLPREAGRGDRAPQDGDIREPEAADRLLLPSVEVNRQAGAPAPKLNAFLESEGYGAVPCDVAPKDTKAKWRTTS